jgi:pimeloyl-ACP methyl ester carboxylesterase
VMSKRRCLRTTAGPLPRDQWRWEAAKIRLQAWGRSLKMDWMSESRSEPPDVIRRNNVGVVGQGQPPLLFAHGFGCDQNMWRLVVPAFEASHRVVLFDHVGAGQSDTSAYDRKKYGTLDGYATDVLDICRDDDWRAGREAGAESL